MPLKRLAVGIAAAFLFSTLGLATGADAKRFSLIGGGAQAHIGNGLMVPIQAAAGAGTTGAMFPNLRVGVNGQAVLSGTIAKPLMSRGQGWLPATAQVPIGALGKAANKTTVGVFSRTDGLRRRDEPRVQVADAPGFFSTGNAVATTTIAQPSVAR